MKSNLLFFVLSLFLTGTQAIAAPALIGGKPADKDQYPASVYTEQSGGRCSGTLIGPSTLLFAAHCVKNKGPVTFTLNGIDHFGSCTHAPEYRKNATADWALCLLSEEITGVPFEIVNTDPDFVTKEDVIELTGYGCIRRGGGGGNDGVYRTGIVEVIDIPAGSDFDIVTKGPRALCFGDSGGPAFKYEENQESPKGQRRVIAVNSRGNIKDTSYLSSVANEAAIRFFYAWADGNDQKICGLHVDAPNCRSVVYETPNQHDCIFKTLLESPNRYTRCMLNPEAKQRGKK